MQDFKQLAVWQRAHQLALAVYSATAAFPREELYGLTSQIRRASVSVPSNIAEGCGRRGSAEFAQFLNVAMGSASELEYQLLLARDLSYLHPDRHAQLAGDVAQVKRMLTGLTRKISIPKLTTDN